MTKRHVTLLLGAALAASTLATAAPAQRREAHSALSPDGRWRVSVRPDRGPPGAGGDRASSLWLTDTRSGATRMLFRGTPSRDPKRSTISIDRPDFSLDGGYVYVEADAYATSPAIHQINVRSGAARYVTDGGLVGVLRTGPWRGYLVVSQHRYRASGGSYDPVLVYRPDGREIATVPGSVANGDDAVGPWLRAKGWRLS